MDKRTTGIIVTLLAVLLCGCPGLLGIFTGFLMSAVSYVPGAEIDMFGSNEPRTALTTGLVIVCFSLIGIAIPFLVGYLTLVRKQPGEVVHYNEPPPPVS